LVEKLKKYEADKQALDAAEANLAVRTRATNERELAVERSERELADRVHDFAEKRNQVERHAADVVRALRLVSIALYAIFFLLSKLRGGEREGAHNYFPHVL